MSKNVTRGGLSNEQYDLLKSAIMMERNKDALKDKEWKNQLLCPIALEYPGDALFLTPFPPSDNRVSISKSTIGSGPKVIVLAVHASRPKHI
jgi:hypothetical protein